MKSVNTKFGTITGRGEVGEEFVDNFSKAIKDARTREKAWVKYLRHIGISGALKNDGHVDWKNNNFKYPSYKYFNDGTTKGDLVAIGSPWKFKTVKISEVGNSRFFNITTYYFIERSYY